MSESLREAGETPGGEAPPTAGFGRPLAQARAARGLGLNEVAARLRLHPRQVKAIEEERLDELPEMPFVRGFVRNYAKELQLDPGPLLVALERAAPARAPTSLSLTTAVAGAESHRLSVERGSRSAVIGGGLTLLVVLGLIGWFASQRATPPIPAATETARSEPQSPVAAPVAAPVASGPGPASEASATSGRTAAGIDPAPAPVAPSGAPAVVAMPAGEAAAGALLRLTVGGRPSWVEITQADGRVVLSGLQEPGTDRRLGPAQPPLHLVIGNASSVTLEYRGRRIDLAGHTRANDLARLTLE